MTPWIHVAGWTLVHFAWQGALIGVVAACALRLARRREASTRYLIACAALALMLASPMLTARFVATAPAGTVAAALRGQLAVAAPDVAAATSSTSRAASAARPAVDEPRIPFDIDLFLPPVVAAWFVGVMLLFIRLAGGWWRVRGLHHASLATAVSTWQVAGERMASRLRLTRVISVVDSRLVDTPTVIGWLRPVVLLPIAALASLTPAQVDAILAHELAHVRRHDFVVNALQTIAETLLFYHPAVWWVSARIRAEREHCCDDVVMEVCGDADGYASALAELETWRLSPAGQVALAATDGPLVERIRRVLRVPMDDERPSSNAIVTIALVATFVVVAGGIGHLTAGKVPPPPMPPSPFVARAGAGQAAPPLLPSPPLSRGADWHTYATDHFEIYFTPNLNAPLDRVAREAERAYGRVSTDLQHHLPSRVTLILFGTNRDMTVSDGAAAEIVRASGAPARDHLLLALEPAGAREGALAHELTHHFEFDMLPRSVLNGSPHWVREGLPEFERGEWVAGDLERLRELVRTNAVPRVSGLDHASFADRLNDSIGHAAFEFIDARWGKDGVRRFLAALAGSTASLERVYLAAFGLAPDDFDRGFTEYLRARFQPPPSAQAGRATGPAFDVTSVKPNNSGEGRITMLPAPGGGWKATNVTLGMLVRIAFQLQDNQIVGGPKWLFSDRFDVLGSGNAPGREGAMLQKLQTLLADRFSLTTHVEKRELPMFALVMAGRDAKLGPKLTSSAADCAPPAPPPGGSSGQPQPRPFVMPARGEIPRCGWMMGPGRLAAGGQTMAQLATNLSRLVGGMVADKTNLAGNFDLALEYTPDPNMAGRGDLPPLPPGAAPDRPASDGPSIFTALQEQLGLKLESTKGPVDVFVIDLAQKPSED